MSAQFVASRQEPVADPRLAPVHRDVLGAAALVLLEAVVGSVAGWFLRRALRVAAAVVGIAVLVVPPVRTVLHVLVAVSG